MHLSEKMGNYTALERVLGKFCLEFSILLQLIDMFIFKTKRIGIYPLLCSIVFDARVPRGSKSDLNYVLIVLKMAMREVGLELENLALPSQSSDRQGTSPSEFCHNTRLACQFRHSGKGLHPRRHSSHHFCDVFNQDSLVFSKGFIRRLDRSSLSRRNYRRWNCQNF